MSFSSLGLNYQLLLQLNKQFYTNPYPIQSEAIPKIIAGKDVIGIAPTGSGKTVAYALPLIQKLIGKPLSSNRHPKVLILVPTRELAVQVEKVVKSFCLRLPEKIKSMAVYGGVSINPQMINLNGVQILVATTGRLLDLIDAKAVHLSEVDALVLDEADKMLNVGFAAEMEKILKLLPSKRQNLLFSATFSLAIEELSHLLLSSPEKVEIAATTIAIDLIQQQAFAIEDEAKGPFLRKLIKEKNLTQVLVFTSSVFRADAVTEKLNINGIKALAMHSKKSQGARTEALAQFKAGKISVLVATDIMSRGIDIPFLPCVINYELPRSPKDFIHRIGRTGRAESSGIAISFVNSEEQHHFSVIQKKMKKVVPLEIPV
jgi:ATP-dependent RNA helicase RhlE